MTTADIIAAIEDLDLARLTEIRRAVDARADKIKADFLAQAEAFNGKKKRKPRTSKETDPEDNEPKE
jgi:vacuolar-type H+-ATPase subunit E/Vma4